MKLPRRSLVIYSAAFLGAGVATAIRFALDPILGEHLVFAMYFLAVSVAAWAGGIRPAMITAILSSILANFLFTEPRGRLQISSAEDLCSLIVFLSVSLLIGVLSEISLKSMERARAAEQQKDDFLAILRMSYAVHWPLFTIPILRKSKLARRAAMGRSNIIDRQVQQLDQMIDDLTDISRVARGKFRLAFERVGVTGLIDDSVKQEHRFISERDQELIVERPSEELIVWADRLRLQQVLTNLLRNASRNTLRGGRIELAHIRTTTARCSACAITAAALPKSCSAAYSTCTRRWNARSIARGRGSVSRCRS